MKLVIHIGTHKTATTTIQTTLNRNRASLRKSGIWYPSYPEILPDVSNHYAHLDLAKGLMSESNKFTPEQVAQFFEVLHKKATAAGDVDTVLISSEPFYRGQTRTEAPYWERRDEYIRNLRSLLPFDEPEVVIVLRRQDDYLESLYNEQVKVSRYSDDIWSFFNDYRSRFEYKQQIEAWSRHFPVVNVATFEDLVKAASVTGRFLDVALSRRDLPIEDVTEKRNVSLPLDLLEFKRHLNGTSLGRAKLRSVVQDLQAVAQARTAPEPGRRSRLSEADCRKVLAEFVEDNQWINDQFFGARPEGLFPQEIRPRQTAEPLDVQACIGIVAELLRRQRTAAPPAPEAGRTPWARIRAVLAKLRPSRSPG